jgi:hypothetical protein
LTGINIFPATIKELIFEHNHQTGADGFIVVSYLPRARTESGRFHKFTGSGICRSPEICLRSDRAIQSRDVGFQRGADD